MRKLYFHMVYSPKQEKEYVVQAFANSILLPVVAIGLVMVIMKLNIDPAGPELMLDFNMYTGIKDLSHSAIIPVAGPALPLEVGSQFVKFHRQNGVNNSLQMSQQLLHSLFNVPARFGMHRIFLHCSLLLLSLFVKNLNCAKLKVYYSQRHIKNKEQMVDFKDNTQSRRK